MAQKIAKSNTGFSNKEGLPDRSPSHVILYVLKITSALLYFFLICDPALFRVAIEPEMNALYLAVSLISLMAIFIRCGTACLAKLGLGTILVLCLLLNGLFFGQYIQSLQLLALILFGFSLSMTFTKAGIFNLLLLGNIVQFLIMFSQPIELFKPVRGSFENSALASAFLSLPCITLVTRLFEKREAIFKANGLLYIAIIIVDVVIIISNQTRACLLALVIVTLLILLKKLPLQRKIQYTLIGFCITSVMLYLTFKRDSANGRLLIWKIASTRLPEFSIAGKGLDAFYREYFLWQSNYFSDEARGQYEQMLADSIRYAFNEYLQIGVELGIPFLIGLLYFTYNRLKSLSKNENDFWLTACIVCLLITCFFSYSLHCAPILALLVAMLNIIQCGPYLKWNIPKPIAVISFVLAGIALCWAFEARRRLDTKWQKAYYFYLEGHSRQSLQAYKSIASNMQSDGNFLYNYSTILLKYGNAKDALSILKLAKEKIGGYDVYNALGYCFLELNDRRQAEKYFTISRFAIPNRFVPRFYLLKLYEKYGNTDGLLKATARAILMLPVKVSSETVNTVRATAEAILSSRYRDTLDVSRFSELREEYKQDSLKLACLDFLLANTKNKYSVTVRYEDSEAGNSWGILGTYKTGDINSFLAGNGIHLIKDTIFDTEQLTASYLKNTIDLAVSRCRSSSIKYSFGTFSNYILPYRVGTEPLVSWRDSLYKKYICYVSTQGKGVWDMDLYKALRQELDSWLTRNSLTPYARFMQSPNQDAFNIMQVKYPYSCEVEALFIIYTYRSLGIPAAYERIFHWAKFNFGHSHAAIMYNNGKFYPADRDTVKFKYQIAKMYRRSFSKTENPYNELRNIGQDSINIPTVLNFENYIDVTRERTEVSDMKLIASAEVIAQNPAAYLCVYNSGRWIPVAWGARDRSNDNYQFKEMGRKILYHLSIVENGVQKLIGRPVVLDTLGNLQYMGLSTKKAQVKMKMFDRYHLIEKGKSYALFQWNSLIHRWEKLQIVVAPDEFVTFNVPEKTLLKIEQEGYAGDPVRPFTFDPRLNKQIWW